MPLWEYVLVFVVKASYYWVQVCEAATSQFANEGGDLDKGHTADGNGACTLNAEQTSAVGGIPSLH